MMMLKIKPEFKNLISSLSDGEYQGLTDSLLAHGCRDAIKTWRGFIIDGHNRYEICHKHDIPFEIKKLRFSSKEKATLWIIENQLGRRNLTDVMKIELAMRKADMLHVAAKQNRSTSGYVQNGSEPIHVRKTIAKTAGVSEHTVHCFMKIRKLGSPDLQKQLDSGDLSIGAAYNKLAVTTRTVEVLYDEDAVPSLKNPLSRKAVARKAEHIIRLYGFIGDNAGYLCAGEDVAPILKKLSAQLEITRGLNAWVCG